MGLSNLGNTCYMNSALQCVTHVEELVNYFASDYYRKEINTTNPIGMNGDVAAVFGKLINSLYNNNSYESAFSPREFKSVIGRYGSAFEGYQQQDSQEFLAFLLDGLHEDLNRVITKPATEKPELPNEEEHSIEAIAGLAEACWEAHKKRNDSIILDLFSGLYRSTLVCPVSNNVSITFDPFMDLTLPLPEKKRNGFDLNDCLDLFAKPEVLGENDTWYCSKCKDFRQAEKTIELWDVPDILTIHLKRFASNRSFRDKIDAVVKFPIEGLDLTDRVGSAKYRKELGENPEEVSLVYDLFAVDNHYGGLGGGHYTAYAKNFKDGKWYYFDDSRVRETEPEQSITGAAYLLFYRR
ncbi:peptidase C19, ubiquitin carboxyl-terminal hydrolase 2, partial [Nadsonia fulvescens var. elongata DSM 6958]